MRCKFYLIGSLLAGCALLAGCNKCNEVDLGIPEEIRSYFPYEKYPIGAAWVYENQLTGDLDTFFLSSTHIYEEEIDIRTFFSEKNCPTKSVLVIGLSPDSDNDRGINFVARGLLSSEKYTLGFVSGSEMADYYYKTNRLESYPARTRITQFSKDDYANWHLGEYRQNELLALSISIKNHPDDLEYDTLAFHKGEGMVYFTKNTGPYLLKEII